MCRYNEPTTSALGETQRELCTCVDEVDVFRRGQVATRLCGPREVNAELRLDAIDLSFPRSRVSEVAFEDVHVVAAFGQQRREPRADEACRSCEK